MSATFSPDGTRVVTASVDWTARVWDAATGRPLTSPLEHQEMVYSAAFSPDGTRVITASWDKTARVRDVRPDMGTLPDWARVAERSPFVLNEHGVLMHRSELRAEAASSTVTRGTAAPSK
jgi:WD40 repeat protein